MRIKVSALDYAMGGVLSMECIDEKWRLVAFLSKSLNKTKRNYEIYNKEMLAVIRGLENWRHLLEGAKFKFKVWTDHKNLEYFMKMQKLNRRQAHLLQTQVLSVGQVDESCTGLTQENSIEDSIQDSLPYILKPHSPC